MHNYQDVCNELQPIIDEKLNEIANVFCQHNPGLVMPAEVEDTGDEEFVRSVEMSNGNDKGYTVEILITDARVRSSVECMDSSEPIGFGIMAHVYDREGRRIAAYAPNNYTAEAFTDDKEVLRERISGLDADQLWASAHRYERSLLRPEAKTMMGM